MCKTARAPGDLSAARVLCSVVGSYWTVLHCAVLTCTVLHCVVSSLCRPLSKTVRFNVLRVIPAGAGDKKGFSSF